MRLLYKSNFRDGNFYARRRCNPKTNVAPLFSKPQINALLHIATKRSNLLVLSMKKNIFSISLINTPVEFGQFLMKPSGDCRNANLSENTWQLCKHKKNYHIMISITYSIYIWDIKEFIWLQGWSISINTDILCDKRLVSLNPPRSTYTQVTLRN